MKKTFLDYYKEILEKVSFDPHLLNKEYQKAINTLNTSEIQEFHNWLHESGLRTSIATMKANSHSLTRFH
jgi:hypothetical protein